MFVTLSTLAVSALGAGFLGHWVASTKSIRIIRKPLSKVTLVKENTLLTTALINELERIEKAKQKNPADLDLVVRSFRVIVRLAWPAGTYYDKSSVSPFVSVLATSCALERDNITSEYCELLSTVIQKFSPVCSEAIVRGENGNEVTTFTYHSMESLDVLTRKIENYNRKVMNLSKNSQR